MALKVKLMSVPTTSDDLPSQAFGLQNQSLSRGDSRKFAVPYFKGVLPESFGIGYNQGITSARGLLLDGRSNEPVHGNLSLLRERNIERLRSA